MTALRNPFLVALVIAGLAGCGQGALDELEGDEGVVEDPTNDELDEGGITASEQGLAAPMIDAEELAFLTALNTYRAANGKAKMRVSIGLTRASNAHSADMAANNWFSHDSSNGTNFATRIYRSYSCSVGSIGENIAKGCTGGASCFELWKNSPPHNANMLNGTFKYVGISRVPTSSGTYYWTTDFGSCADAILSAGFGTIATNGGFESTSLKAGVNFSAVRTLGLWHTYAATGGSVVRSTSAKLAGAYGLRCVDPDPGTSAATQVVRASQGVNYRVSALARRVSGATQQALYLDFLDANYARLLVKSVAAPAVATATRFQVEYTAPAKTRYVRAILYGSGTGGNRSTYDWDDVRVEAW